MFELWGDNFREIDVWIYEEMTCLFPNLVLRNMFVYFSKSISLENYLYLQGINLVLWMYV